MAERRPRVRVTLVERTCADCGRTALDVRVDIDSRPRCFSGVGCQAKVELARRLVRGAS